MNSKITQLAKISKSFCKQYKEDIKEIILFGSILRGKSVPNDIDILLIFFKTINKDIEYELKKKLTLVFDNISLISKSQEQVYVSSFTARESIIFEGYSLVTEEFIASLFGFNSLGIFVYDTKKLNNTNKTRFYYALNGRRKAKGITDALEAIKLSDNIIAVPLQNIEAAKAFFEQWNLEYNYVPSLIPSRLAKKSIIGKVR